MNKTLALAALLLASFMVPAQAQQVLQTPVTTMAPNKRIYTNNQFPKKNKKNLGRDTAVIIELADAPSTTPGRWPGYSPLGTVGRNMGGFRIFSYFSHFAFDDPIVYPGQGGRSHCHAFFGNTATRGVTTPVSIRTTGNSTSAGGTVNRSGYWVSCMVYVCDSLAKITAGCNWLRNGELQVPTANSGLNVYYKSHFGEELDTTGKPSGYWLFNNDTQPFPVGFRMIAGTPTATPANPHVSGGFSNQFVCNYTGDLETPYDWIPGTGGTTLCPAGTYLLKQNVRFPSCWNGVDLDSPTHNTHVVFPSRVSESGYYTMLDSEDWFCPSSHPIVLPGVTFKLHYNYPGDTDIKFWRLSSDNYDTSKEAGRSTHGDWFNGWDQTIMDEWVANCMVRGVDCHDNVLGPAVTSGFWRVLAAPIGISQ